jgi:hypothetical protein
MSDDDATPTETPSAMHKLGLAVCFACNGARFVDGVKCGTCDGGGRVTLKEFNEHVGLADYDKLPDTLPASSSEKPHG